MLVSAITLTALMAATAASIIHQDWRTTHVHVWRLMLLLGLAGLFAALAPLDHTPRIEHLLGAALAAVCSTAASWGMGRAMGRVAFGGADGWILTAGGLALGMQWLAPWIGLSVVLGIASFALGHHRPDPDSDDQRPVLPFAPILLLTFLVLLIGRLLEWLPARLL